MICEKCNEKSSVTYVLQKENQMWRRRKCGCGSFTTTETITEEKFPYPYRKRVRKKPSKKKKKSDVTIESEIAMEDLGIKVTNKSPDWLKKIALKLS